VTSNGSTAEERQHGRFSELGEGLAERTCVGHVVPTNLQ
jgi:hypothetical protein